MSDERINTRCPVCGHQTLFIGSGGHLTCSWLKCPNPGVESAIDAIKKHRAEVDDLVLWTLGEIGDFPMLPDDWPKRKFYWRHSLRQKFEALQATRRVHAD